MQPPNVGVHSSALSIIVLGNYFPFAAFAGWVIAAVLLRHKAAAHKRLMLLAAIAIIGPTLRRVPNISVHQPGRPRSATTPSLGY